MMSLAGPGRLAVIGAGSWGTTLANLVAAKGYQVTLWARDGDLVRRLQQTGENERYLPGISLHPSITPTADLRQAADATALFISAVPSQAVRPVWQLLAPYVPAHALLISATKGIDIDSLSTMSHVLGTVIRPEQSPRLAVLSGPNFAQEVSRNMPTAAVLAAATPEIAQEGQQLLSTPAFRVYTSTDTLGVEIGGALKNVIALAAGVCDGAALGYNARAALITRGLAEMSQLGMAMGAQARTFAGLSGLGDLVLTCTGSLSRNYSVGLQLGQGKKLTDILAHMRMVAEGISTAGAAVALGARYQVDMPIAEHVYAILHGHITPHEAVTALMTRALKHEDA